MAEVFSFNTFPSHYGNWTITSENNVVPKEKLEELKKIPFFMAFVKSGKYVIKETKSDAKPGKVETDDQNTAIVEEIKRMTVTEAKKVILGDGEDNHGVLDIWVLKELVKSDSRTGVVNAAQKQIDFLYTVEKDEDEDQE